MIDVQVDGATERYEAEILSALSVLPDYVVKAGRIAKVKVADEPLDGVASYEHRTRNIYIAPDLDSSVLLEAIVHEWAHAFDDNFNHHHYFSESPGWVGLSKQTRGDYKPVEAFAEAMVDHLLDPKTHRSENTEVARYCDYALAYLRNFFY